jgi:hypothetical protein
MPFKLRIASMFNLICVRRSFATQLCERDPRPVFVQVAGAPMARFDFAKCRRLVPAARQRVGTARVEMVAQRRVDLARNVALEVLPINRSLVGARVERISSATAPEMCLFLKNNQRKSNGRC